MSLAFIPARPAERHPVIERAIVADFGGFSDHHAHTMVNEEAPADFRTGMNFNSCKPAGKCRKKTRQPFRIEVPKPVCQMMHENRVHSRVGGDDLEGTARSGIALEYTLNIFSDSLQHRSHQVWKSG